MVQIRNPWIFQEMLDGMDRMSRCPSWAFGGVEALNSRKSGSFTVTETTATLQLDLPGVAEEDVNISLENNRIKIEAKRGDARSEAEEVILRERSFGEFSREYRLPWPVAAEGVQARLEEGVLTLDLERNPDSAPRRIEVKSASSATN